MKKLTICISAMLVVVTIFLLQRTKRNETANANGSELQIAVDPMSEAKSLKPDQDTREALIPKERRSRPIVSAETTIPVNPVEHISSETSVPFVPEPKPMDAPPPDSGPPQSKLSKLIAAENFESAEEIMKAEASPEAFTQARSRSVAITSLDPVVRKALEGHYEGILREGKINKEPWTVSIDIVFSGSNDADFESNYSFLLSSPSKGIFSRTTGSGRIDSVRLGEDSHFLFEMSPEISIQFKYLQEIDAMIGNIYGTEGKKPEYLGPVILKRS